MIVVFQDLYCETVQYSLSIALNEVVPFTSVSIYLFLMMVWVHIKIYYQIFNLHYQPFYYYLQAFSA